MTTSIWVSVSTILAAREVQVIDDDDQIIPTEAALAEIQKAKMDSAIRWAVVIGEDEHLRLHTQLLPVSGESLSGKPILRGSMVKLLYSEFSIFMVMKFRFLMDINENGTRLFVKKLGLQNQVRIYEQLGFLKAILYILESG